MVVASYIGGVDKLVAVMTMVIIVVTELVLVRPFWLLLNCVGGNGSIRSELGRWLSGDGGGDRYWLWLLLWWLMCGCVGCAGWLVVVLAVVVVVVVVCCCVVEAEARI